MYYGASPCRKTGYVITLKDEHFLLISFLHFLKTATLFASSLGIKVTVEDSKCVQANAFIQEGVFHQFGVTDEQITFKINLTVLLVIDV